MLVDTHQHLIFADELNYPWIEQVPPLQKRHGVEEYRRDCGSEKVDKTLFMEVDVAEDDQLAEVRLISKLATDPGSRVAGIIASGRPETKGFAEHLDRLREFPVKGLRRVLHVMPDETSADPLFRENIRRLARHDLTFDLVVRSDQLSYAIALVDDCPEVSFILDHCGNPDIAGGEWESWRKLMGQLAERDHVCCKLSGIAVNAGKRPVNDTLLHPYLSECLEAFGPRRLCFGGDWPVCQLATTLEAWIRNFRNWMSAQLNGDEQAAVSAENAERIYKI